MSQHEWFSSRSPERLRQLAWLGGYKLSVPACEDHEGSDEDADCDACIALLRRRVPEAHRSMLEIKAPITLVYGEFNRTWFLDVVRFQRKTKDRPHTAESPYAVSQILGRRVSEVEYAALVGDQALRDIAGVMFCLGEPYDTVVLDGLLDRLHPNACRRMMEYLDVYAREHGVSIVIASNSAAPLCRVPSLVSYEDVVVIDKGGAARLTALRSEEWLDNFRIESLFVPGGFQSLRRGGSR